MSNPVIKQSVVNRLLIVDDQQEIISALERLLKKRFHCRFASNADDAWSIIRTKGIHVVPSDIQTPGVDGTTF